LPREKEEKLFELDEFKSVAKTLIERALDEANGEPIFEKFPQNASIIFPAWTINDAIALNKYLKKLFVAHPKKAEELIFSYAPIVHSSTHPEPYRTNFDEDRYNYFITIFDKDLIYKSISLIYNQEELKADDVKWSEHMEENSSMFNTVRQFLYWYNLKQK
jgi:hypothetical protein